MPSNQKPNVLVVDDKRANLFAMKMILEKLDANIFLAESGNEALSLILRYQFAVVLLDVQMPDMDGFETAELMMQVEESKLTPIIFVTAVNKDEKYAFKGYELGAVDYLFKPVDSHVLIGKVETFLKLHKQKTKLCAQKTELGIALKKKNELLSEIEKQNKNKSNLLAQLKDKNKKLKKYSKVWILFAILIFSIIFIYSFINLKKNIQLTAYVTELSQLNDTITELNKAYKRFMPHDFLKLLDKDSIIDVHLGDQVQKKMAVMFVDIRDYTSLSENMTPKENIDFINNFFAILQPAISNNGGIINKYLGDGLMALFPNNNDDAVQSAIEILHRLSKLNQDQKEKGLTTISIGIGIDGGILMLGTVGKEERMEQTVYGDVVNVASRLEGVTKIYGTQLLISDNIFSRLKDPNQYTIRFTDTVKIKGREKPVTVYQVLDGEESEVIQYYKQTMKSFSKGVNLFQNKKIEEAKQAFHDVLSVNKDDIAAWLYYKRCEELEKNPMIKPEKDS